MGPSILAREEESKGREKGPVPRGKTNEVPENMFCRSPHTTKWHTSKHVKDQLELIELESGETTVHAVDVYLYGVMKVFQINFASLGNLISLRLLPPSLDSTRLESAGWWRRKPAPWEGFKFKWENGIKLIVPWCYRSRLSRVHSALPHSRAGGRTCTLCRDVNTYFAETLDTLPVEAIASLFRSVDSTCRP